MTTSCRITKIHSGFTLYEDIIRTSNHRCGFMGWWSMRYYGISMKGTP